MKPISIILTSFLVKMDEILGSIWGWLLTFLCGMCNFLFDYKIVFIGVFLCIFWDAVAGIWAAVKQGKFVRSELLRDTFSKLFAYGGSMIVVVFIEKMIVTGESTWCTNIIGACICATELWSIGANMLIVNPRLRFFRIFKSALIGEIARKLGLTEEEVKKSFEYDDKKEK